MICRVLGILALLHGLAHATSWMPMLDAELVRKSEWIAVGRLVTKGGDWRVEVERLIKGDPIGEIPIHPVGPFVFGTIEEAPVKWIFCIARQEGGNRLIHPAAVRPLTDEPEIRRALRMLAEPARFIVEKRDPELAYLIGQLFADPKVMTSQGLKRDVASEYLDSCLVADDGELLIETVKSLRALKKWDSVSKVCDLLKPENKNGILWAMSDTMSYLEDSKAPEAIEYLQQLLAETSRDYPAQHWLADPAAQVLGRIAGETSLDVIELAAKRGVQRAEEALIYLGTKETYQVLMDAYLVDEEPGLLPNTLHCLVLRSNREAEDWMSTPTYNSHIGNKLKPKWKTWWDANRDGFEIVRTFEEVLKLRDAENAN